MKSTEKDMTDFLRGNALHISFGYRFIYAIWIPLNFGHRYGGNTIELTESSPIKGDLEIPGGMMSIGNCMLGPQTKTKTVK
ncbi:hypothetical protein TRIP_E80006 [uncultured Spirochaetota bacterium]|nr:hypothetical protein TRIP_E80006 [uncultured Spirochaetota bacterium]